MFDHIINWKLLSGSHDFPGPDGGTCINEAAIVAAGFKYKKISCAADCPPCFSRPIAAYAIKLNNSMPDGLRQKLLIPFVTRLAGTADTKEMELKRGQFMVVEHVKRIRPLFCETRFNRPDLAAKCRAVSTIWECREVAQEVRKVAQEARKAAYAAADAAKEKIYTIACEILNDAILLGKHEDLPVEIVAPRLEKIKREKIYA